MTTVETYPPAERKEPARDGWGRPKVIPPGGGQPTAYTRCTTFVDCLEDKWMLQKWQQRMVALGLSQRRDLALAFSAIAPDLMQPVPPKSAKSKANAVCEQAIEAAQGTAAATTGTALHAFTELIDMGRDVGAVDDDTAADLAAYQQATAPLTALHIEEFTVHDELRIGGTPDRIVEFEGRNYIADLKTGGIDLAALKIAMQLAVYAHSRFYDVDTGARSNLPNVDLDRAIVIHLPAGTGKCTLHWIDIAAGWQAVDVARQVREWRQRAKRLLTPIDTQTALTFDEPAPKPAEPVDDGLAELRNQIASAPDAGTLGNLWRANKDRWTSELSDLASARKRLLVEAGGRP